MYNYFNDSISCIVCNIIFQCPGTYYVIKIVHVIETEYLVWKIHLGVQRIKIFVLFVACVECKIWYPYY